PDSSQYEPSSTFNPYFSRAADANPATTASPTTAAKRSVRRVANRAIAKPPAALVSTSGSTPAVKPAPVGSSAGNGTTSCTSAVSPGASSAAAVLSICATAGLPADATRSCGPFGPTTTAPYTSRSMIASVAAASSATCTTSNAGT